MRPNIFLGTCEGSTQYKKWYFEMMVDHVEPFVTAQATHLRVGWALTEGYSPYPGGGEGWGGNGVGDDLYSYGFDGQNLWSGKLCPGDDSPPPLPTPPLLLLPPPLLPAPPHEGRGTERVCPLIITLYDAVPAATLNTHVTQDMRAE